MFYLLILIAFLKRSVSSYNKTQGSVAPLSNKALKSPEGCKKEDKNEQMDHISGRTLKEVFLG